MTCPSESFNPRSPCGERPSHMPHSAVASYSFQPTLPLRGATTSCSTAQCGSCFNPRSPCGERRCSPSPPRGTARFNPRSPCGERRATEKKRENLGSFQPTLPLRGATTPAPPSPEARVFQPTLPLRGATGTRARGPGSAPCFNPRSPCGERQAMAADGIKRQMFQPTLPLRGATGHTLNFSTSSSSFQPTLPLRGATPWRWHRKSSARVSTHAPLAGSDASTRARSGAVRCFNPRSPCGERLLHLVNVALRAYHMHDVFHPNASSDELRPSEANQKAVRTSQGIPDSPQFAPPIIPTAYS